MASLNKALIIGNVGKDPEVVTFQDGSELAKFTLAATEKYTGRDGQQKSETEWFNIVAGGKLAAVVKQFVHKGSQVYVEGKFRTRTYQKKDGATGYSTEVQCMTLQLLGGAPQQPAQQVQRPEQPQYQQPQYQQQPMPQRPPMPMPQKPVAPQYPQNPAQAIQQEVQQAVENQQAYDADMPDWMR
jgi:single-strand DNA-binding protein